MVDAGGLALMPGTIDLRTHYDAQVTWDPTLSPSPSLGVTTAIMGNCGFGIVPSLSSICRKPLILNGSTHTEAFVASGGDLVTFLLVCGDAAYIGHEDTVFAGDIGTDIP
jgi:N-acyl-D-aspartate/D-glutamate deacylase